MYRMHDDHEAFCPDLFSDSQGATRPLQLEPPRAIIAFEPTAQRRKYQRQIPRFRDARVAAKGPAMFQTRWLFLAATSCVGCADGARDVTFGTNWAVLSSPAVSSR